MAYELLPDDPIQNQPVVNTKKDSGLSDLGKDALSVLGQNLARAGETVAGIPGNTLSTLGTIGNFITSPFPKPLPTYEDIQKELPNYPEWAPFVGGLPLIPTSEQIREKGKELTGGALEPESESAKNLNNFTETFTDLFTPGIFGKGLKFSNAVKSALGGETFKYIAEQLGASDLVQGAARFAGILFGGTAFEKGPLKKLQQETYDELKKTLPGKELPVTPVNKSIDSLIEGYKNKVTPEKKYATDILKELKGAISGIAAEGVSSTDQLKLKYGSKKGIKKAAKNIPNETIDAHKLWELKKGINAYYPKADKNERRALDDIVGALKNGLKPLGKDFEKLEMADDIFSAFKESSIAKNFIEKYVPEKSNPMLKLLFFGGSNLVNKLPYSAGLYGTFKVGSEGNKIYKFLSKPSGNAQKYYGDILKAGFEGNGRAVARNIAKLNHEANKFDKEYKEEDEEEGRYTLVD